MRTALVVLLLVAIALAWTNPEMDDFTVFAQAQSERLLLQEAGEGAFGQFLSGLAGTLTGQYVDRITRRANYVVCSTYTIDLDGPDADAEEWRFLGIAGRFLVLEEPASLGRE